MMDRVRRLAWDLYVSRVQRVMDGQYQAVSNGHPAIRLYCDAPAEREIQAIRDALILERAEGIKETLGPIVSALDAIDNSRSKSESVQAARAQLQELYDELHQMKDAGPSEVATEAAIAKAEGR